MDNASTFGINPTTIAKICHEANKTYCEAIGDASQKSWDESPDWLKTSGINGVNFHLTNKDASASASHESWLKEKQETGWKHGAVKDADKKEHPCFVPYDQLPIQQQIKDFIFRNIVHAFIDAKAPLYDVGA